MKKWFVKNWMAKITSLLLAIALWFLINEHLMRKSQTGDDARPPTGTTVPPEVNL